jgi:8-oxo-dGTP pyrophosphatase MutT (NUDIX family)
VPLFGWPDRPGLIFTERRRDMRRHAGEISFPGGRTDPGETLVECALREAHEEIGLDPSVVEIVGALPPTSTVVTSYKVLPVVGLVPASLAHELSPREVEQVIEIDLDELRSAHGMRRLIRRGVPFRTPVFDVEGAFIWGATARMLQLFFERLDARP